MKKILVSLIILLSITRICSAQWAVNGTAINNTNTGNVIVNSTLQIQPGNGSFGYIQSGAGSTGVNGYAPYLGWYIGNSTRLGYIGYSNSNMNYVAENGAMHMFTGGDVGIGARAKLYGDVLVGQATNNNVSWEDVINAVQIGNMGAVAANANGANQIALANNWYRKVGVGNVYIRSLSSSWLNLNGSNLELYYAPAGTAGSVVPFTKVFTVDNLGNTTANSFIKPGGTGAQFLKANGTIDNNAYLVVANPTFSGTLNGPNIHTGQVLVDASFTVPDYVFDKDYDLSSLKDVKAYIDKKHHLPEMPSAAQITKDGINVGEMNMKLLKKIEELTLYLIEKDKQLSVQNSQIQDILKTNQEQQKQLDSLKKSLKL